MKELKTKEEAVDFVFNQLHTCCVIDTTPSIKNPIHRNVIAQPNTTSSVYMVRL